MSWSEGKDREKSANELQQRERKRDAITTINGVLAMLAADTDLHEDLQLPIVQVAMQHWTGAKRLPPEQATRICENLRVMSVLQKVQRLSAVCNTGGIAVPLELMLKRVPYLPDEFVIKYFGIPVSSKPDSATTANATAPLSGESKSRSISKPVYKGTREFVESSNVDNVISGSAGVSKATPFTATGEPSATNQALDESISNADRLREGKLGYSKDLESKPKLRRKSSTSDVNDGATSDQREVGLKVELQGTEVSIIDRIRDSVLVLVVIIVVYGIYTHLILSNR